jgi:hypothetical protein
MNTEYRTRKLVVSVSQDAQQALQNEAVRVDCHMASVASEISEKALTGLNYKSPRADLPDDGPATSKELMSGQRQWREEALRIIEEQRLCGAEAVDLLLEYEDLDRRRDADIARGESDSGSTKEGES